MFQKKKNYTYCMNEKLHDKLVRFVKKTKRRSLSEFFAELGRAEMIREKKKKGDMPDG